MKNVFMSMTIKYVDEYESVKYSSPYRVGTQ